VEGERRRVEIGETRHGGARGGGGALGVNRQGAAGNGGFGGENGGIWGKRAGRRWCPCQGGPGRRIGAAAVCRGSR
jgi:hypothetical protein